MSIVETIRIFVENESKKPTSKYGYEPYEFHFVPMVRYAEELAEELGADKEIVALSGWLHDIGSLVDDRDNHHITGAEIAEEKLRELNYPEDRIERVKKCILNHRGSIDNNRDSLEEKIIAEADIISNFDDITGLFQAALVYEGLNRGEAKEAVRKKLENKYKQLNFDKSREIIKPKYEAAMLLFS
ncbi:metal-dependent phosphohydrolase [bacterium (Candidatus Howlettbacteria) CG_4_10_14_0_8_um_filter_40_9]|nr:MAG: metal-dependent phosphohydrolase [bacterium (Candidatus Howlettbacteria) CG_4_10_14_0_8_um_filter_40_9]